MVKLAVKMDKLDNVAVILEDINEEDLLKVDSVMISARQRILRGHKIAVADIEKGEFIIKYGVPIGKAKCQILAGEHVHIHNVEDITVQINKHINFKH